MHIYATIAGLFLIAYGVLLLRRPNLFRRGIWMKTGIAERNLSPERYIKYSRGVGVFNIVLGIAVSAWGLFTPLAARSERHDPHWDAERDAQPSKMHPYGGFWKIRAQDQWGLAIGPYDGTSYYVSFCGPGGCFAKGSYRPATSLVGDPQYRILDMNHIEMNGKKGFITYQRSNGRNGNELVQR